jgi:hypothetical protein
MRERVTRLALEGYTLKGYTLSEQNCSQIKEYAVACFEFTAFDCRNARSASGMGQSRPRLPALAPPDVRYASISDQGFAAPRLVATRQSPTSLAVQSTPKARLRCQLIEQRFGLFHIERVEAFSEPVINRSEKIVGLLPHSE